jgi:diguanylate cyclase (GGDEF)-like protein
MKRNTKEDAQEKQEITFLNAPLLKYMVTVGMVTCFIGTIYSSVFIYDWVSTAVNFSGFLLLTFIRIKYKSLMTQTLGCIVLLYFCFLYTPFIWISAGGLTSNITYGVFMISCLVVVVLDGMLKRVMLGAYLALISALMTSDFIVKRFYGHSSTMIYQRAFVFCVILTIMLLVLSAVKRQMEATNAQLLKTAQTDELSEAFNSRYLNKKLIELEQRYQENGDDFCVAILDIDDFKKINDTYGHLYGDIVIRYLADCIRKATDEKVQLGRYGGDEFVLIFFDADKQTAYETCEKVRKQIESEQISDKTIHSTISMGVCKRSEIQEGEDILSKIDELLYESKRSGKNKVSYR